MRTWIIVAAILAWCGPALGDDDVTLVPLQTEYALGDTCRFILTNHLPYAITFNSPPILHIFDAGECCVYGYGIYPCVEVEVGPYEVRDLWWDQKTDFDNCGLCEGCQVPIGDYHIYRTYVVEELGLQYGEFEATFSIVEDTPTEDATWARIKALFHN